MTVVQVEPRPLSSVHPLWFKKPFLMPSSSASSVKPAKSPWDVSDYGRLKILVVEDNRHMRSIVKAVLKGAGITNFREARDGAEALAILNQYPADIVLADYSMSPIDGLEFTQALRRASDSANPYLPVIMVTGHSERSRVQEARDAGVNEFVIKPLTARSLLARMEYVVMHPRPYIRCRTYFGPDRRRRRDGGYGGPFRRQADSTMARDAVSDHTAELRL